MKAAFIVCVGLVMITSSGVQAADVALKKAIKGNKRALDRAHKRHQEACGYPLAAEIAYEECRRGLKPGWEKRAVGSCVKGFDQVTRATHELCKDHAAETRRGLKTVRIGLDTVDPKIRNQKPTLSLSKGVLSIRCVGTTCPAKRAVLKLLEQRL